MEELNNQSLDQILGIEDDAISESDLLDVIHARVSDLMEKNPELLFSYLYRLDIDEHKIKWALSAQNLDSIGALSKLILDRQKLRIALKKKYKQDPIDGWEL